MIDHAQSELIGFSNLHEARPSTSEHDQMSAARSGHGRRDIETRRWHDASRPQTAWKEKRGQRDSSNEVNQLITNEARANIK